MADLHKCLVEVEVNGGGGAGGDVELIRKERTELVKKMEEVKKSDEEGGGGGGGEGKKGGGEGGETAKVKQLINQFCRQLSFDPCNTQVRDKRKERRGGKKRGE